MFKSETASAARPQPVSRRHALRLALLPPAALALTACGFRLRGQQSFAFSSLYSGFSENSDLTPVFEQAMRYAAPGVRVISDEYERAQAQVLLDVLDESRYKTVATYNAAGEARELTLHARLRFRLRAADGRELIAASELSQARDMTFSETTALAKEYEEEDLYRYMYEDLIQQLLRRLSALKPL
jgi:LPS-assembly lipoprotein